MFHGGRIVARAIKAEGVDHVFTLCGGHIQNIYDGCIDEGIRVVDTRHEQTAGHAADGWARVTGKPGVALVTAGPGVNLSELNRLLMCALCGEYVRLSVRVMSGT